MPTSDFPLYAEDNNGATADSIREAATEPSVHTDTISTLVTDLTSDHAAVRSEIEGDIADIASANPTAASQTAQTLARNGYYAIGLINQFADAVETYDTTVAQINADLSSNVTNRILEHRPADEPLSYNEIKSDEKSKLQGRFNDAVSALDTAEGTAVSGFEGGAPTEEQARALMLAGYLPLAARGLWPQLQLTPQETYDAYKAAVDNGTLPSLTEMTEAERTEFLDANPGLLDQWMTIENPSQDLQNTVIRLSLPVVGSGDAEDDARWVLEALGDNPSAGNYQFQTSLENLMAINGGLAALRPWAERNNIDLATNGAVGQSQEYLKKFYADTYSHREDLVNFINSDEHEWTYSYNGPGGTYTDSRTDSGFSSDVREQLLSGYADGILNLSNHDLGGGYDDLPQQLRDDATEVFTSEMKASVGGAYWSFDDNENFQALADLLSHSTAEPGDGLAKQMASTAITSMDAHDRFWDNQPGGDDYVGDHNGYAADMLELASRNRDATIDLVSGTDTPGNYPGNFNAIVFNHGWDGENGDEGKVVKLYDWMNEEYAAGGERREAATNAFNHLAGDLTSVGEGGNFSDLMRPGGDAAGLRNPQLANTLLAATTDHLGALEIQDGKPGSSPLDEATRVRLMTLMASDPDTATKLAGAISIHQAQNTDAWASDPDQVRNGLIDLADRNSRLSTYLDASLINEASERGLDAQQAENERIQRIKLASGVVATLAGPISGPAGPVVGPMAGVGNTLLSNLLTADHIPDPSPNLDPSWTAQGGHVTTSSGLNVVRSLVANDYIDPDDVPAVLLDPASATDAQVHQAVTNLLQQTFPGQPTLYTDFNTEVENSYDADLDHLSLKGKDDGRVEAFRSDESWPT